MDKLNLFFPREHTIYFENEPRKQVAISLTNLAPHAGAL